MQYNRTVVIYHTKERCYLGVKVIGQSGSGTPRKKGVQRLSVECICAFNNHTDKYIS